MQRTSRSTLIAALFSITSASCGGATDDVGGAEASALNTETHEGATCAASSTDRPEGILFGEKVSSFVTTSEGIVTSVGVDVPLSAIEAAPADGPFQDELILDMPALAKAQTFLSQLRVNWLAHGHGPLPYNASHFDFHFYRGTTSEIDAIACDGSEGFPPEILTADHKTPDTCVPQMGYHAWPSADSDAGATFTASLILGYTPTQLVFIEPMITKATLLAKRDFELAITLPRKSGSGVKTRFPTRMRARYQPDGLTLRMEFDKFVDLD